MSVARGDASFSYILLRLCHALCSSLRASAKSPNCALSLGLTLLTAAHIMLQKLDDPERPLPSNRARMSAQSLITGISQICFAVSRSISSLSPLIIEVMCAVMKSCRS